MRRDPDSVYSWGGYDYEHEYEGRASGPLKALAILAIGAAIVYTIDCGNASGQAADKCLESPSCYCPRIRG